MSFLKKLFGGGSGGAEKPVAEIDYNGFKIASTPMKEGGQFRVCAMIRKGNNGEAKEHRLIRADVCGSAEDASDIAIRKAKQMIDERGDGIFS